MATKRNNVTEYSPIVTALLHTFPDSTTQDKIKRLMERVVNLILAVHM